MTNMTMNRRKALAFLGTGVLVGCGGGGGGGTPAAASTGGSSAGAATSSGGNAAADTTATQQLVAASGSGTASGSASTPAIASAAPGKNIACWGDSITNLYAPHLQSLYTGRQVYNGGVSGQTSDQINQRVLADTAHKDWVSIFWYGQNDWFKDQVAGNLAASIASLPAGSNFVVVSILNWSTDLPGSTMYNSVLQANLALAQKYPNNFVDMRSWLVAQANASIAQDMVDRNNDETPSSLRFDTIHPNDAGCDLIAGHLRDFISAKGW
jgi:lysophospholipase L1-like esterase